MLGVWRAARCGTRDFLGQETLGTWAPPFHTPFDVRTGRTHTADADRIILWTTQIERLTSRRKGSFACVPLCEYRSLMPVHR